MSRSSHSNLVTSLFASGLALTLVACSADVADGPSAPGAPATLSPPEPAASGPVAPRALDTALPPAPPPVSSSAPVASASAPRVRGPALPLRSTSPGVIDCEDVICDVATQLCCSEWDDGSPPAQLGRCAPKGPAGCGTHRATWRSCDESLDCAKGESCCYVPAWDGGYAQTVCHAGACEDPEYETCLAGGTCRNGKKCKAEKGAAAGYCR